MYRFFLCLFLGALNGSLSVRADIFADFAVSHDGEALGTFRVKLFHEEVPRPVANFVGLATGDLPWLDPRTARIRNQSPYYDGTVFHRLIHDFIIQGGDPLGTGSGGPGYVFQDQFHPALRHESRYTLSMAHAGPHTNGSQFFITLGEAAFLDDLHSVFGVVVDGQEIIDGFANATNFPTNQQNRPTEPIVLESVTLFGDSLAAFREDLHQHGLPRFHSVDTAVELEEPENPEAARGLFLKWARQIHTDYTVLGSTNLKDWETLGFGISMNADAGFRTDVSNIYPGSETAFFQVFGVDYGHLDVPPARVLLPGARIHFNVMNGVLTVQVGPDRSGTWTFVDSEGVTTQGALENTQGRRMFEDQGDQGNPPYILGDTGFYVDQRTLARLLPVRRVTFFFDDGAEVGPWRLTAIQPMLSFHGPQSGWFNGVVNTNSTVEIPPFRGTFSIEFGSGE